MDLSNVPLQVLEKVRNKWVRIHDPNDLMVVTNCAMCDYMHEITNWTRSCNSCPISLECEGLMDDKTPGWNDRRDAFVAGIVAEIDCRAGE